MSHASAQAAIGLIYVLIKAQTVVLDVKLDKTLMKAIEESIIKLLD